MSTGSDTEQTETKSMQFDFWRKCREFVGCQHPELKLRKPAAQHWYDIAIGRSDCHVTMTVLSREDKVGCELYISNSKELFHHLFNHKESIEKELGLEGQLDWQELPERKASRIRLFTQFDFDDQSTWETAFRWLGDACINFKKTFSKDWDN